MGMNRVCDLICIQFISPNKDEISLHIQSFFRILKKDKVLVCSDDMYRCSQDCDSELFEWDIPGKAIYDISLKNNIIDTNATVIKSEINPVGDLQIVFSDGMVLQSLINTVEKEEKYRVFDDYESFIVES